MFFAIVLGQQLAQLLWLAFPTPEQGIWVPRPVKAVQTSANSKKSTINVAQIKQAALFGKYEEAPKQVALVSTEDAPDTNLRLKLRGIVAMELEQDSRALIEANKRKLESYAVGMTISGGAELHSILPDRVLLKRGGRLETLRLEKDKLANNEVVTRVSNRPTDRRGAGSAPRIIDSETAAKLSSIRTELLNDPSKASQYLRVQPARANGMMKGYRIYPGRKRELFKEAGLRPGDIVTSVNGVALDDPGKGFQLLGDLSSAQQLNLQIERGGQLQTVNVNLN